VSVLIKNLKPLWEQFTLPFINRLNKLQIHPNFISLLGIVLTFLAVPFLAKGNFVWGGIFVAAGGLCDALDGHLARYSGKVSPFGALLDSTLDRLADFLPLFGLALYFSNSPFWLTVVLFNIAFWFLVSYVKARLEGLGVKEKIGGLFERTERVATLVVFLILNLPEVGLLITLFGSLFTFLQRLYLGYKLLEK